MGPLASAEFLNTIYRLSREQVAKEPAGKEQSMARVILMSDPDVPDRTKAIEELRAGNPQQFHEVKRRLKQFLQTLSLMQVDRIVIPCVTAHFFLPFLNLPTVLASRICSLTGTVRDALLKEHGKYVILRTNGTWKERIFENQPGWADVSDRIRSVEDCDQARIHDYLYKTKRHGVQPEHLSVLQCLMQKYNANGFIAGCTEAHLHTRTLIANGIRLIDPLVIIAGEIANPTHSNCDEPVLSADS